jgi:hypothetical protein
MPTPAVPDDDQSVGNRQDTPKLDLYQKVDGDYLYTITLTSVKNDAAHIRLRCIDVQKTPLPC